MTDLILDPAEHLRIFSSHKTTYVRLFPWYLWYKTISTLFHHVFLR